MTSQARARYIKSERLAGQLIIWCKEHGQPCSDEVAAKVLLELVPSFTSEDWEQIAHEATKTYAEQLKAGGIKAVHPPHSQETVNEVIARLKAMREDAFAMFERTA